MSWWQEVAVWWLVVYSLTFGVAILALAADWRATDETAWTGMLAIPIDGFLLLCLSLACLVLLV